MENEKEETLAENTMADDELAMYQQYEIVDPENLSPEERHSLAEAVRETGAELGMSGLTPDEYYDHDAEHTEAEQKAAQD